MAAGLWLAAITLHDVLEAVSLLGDLRENKGVTAIISHHVLKVTQVNTVCPEVR